MRVLRFILITFLLVSAFSVVFYYLYLRYNFYDDVFIYLNIAQNAVETGTWQYFPLVNRPALLATSPIKITVLTISSYIGNILGFNERSLQSAKMVLIINGLISYIIWLPFWKRNFEIFLFLGIIYFVLALSLNSIFEFEGGLLFLWIATLIYNLKIKQDYDQPSVSFLFAMGLFIRPEITLPIVFVGLFYIITIKGMNAYFIHAIKSFAILTLLWVLIASFYKVWPIPVTYWAKSSLSTLFEDKHMIYYFFERLGRVSLKNINSQPEFYTLIGTLIVISFLLSFTKSTLSKIFSLILLLLYGFIYYKAPANYWWYYENALILIIGASTGFVISDNIPLIGRPRLKKFLMLYPASILLIVTIGSIFTDGPSMWSFKNPSRSQGYMYLATLAYRGVYNIDGIGYSFIKSPEIGITGYLSGKDGWIYDLGGLAQPLNLDSVQNSPIRFFYPKQLRLDASQDIQVLQQIHGRDFPIITVWAMEDRDYDNAMRKCGMVNVEGALCITW